MYVRQYNNKLNNKRTHKIIDSEILKGFGIGNYNDVETNKKLKSYIKMLRCTSYVNINYICCITMSFILKRVFIFISIDKIVLYFV